MISVFIQIAPHIAALAIITTALYTAAHAILHKKNPRSAIGWVAIVLFFPLIGPLCYLLLGVNHIRRRALNLRTRNLQAAKEPGPLACTPGEIEKILPEDSRHLSRLAHLVDRVTGLPLFKANTVEHLLNGDETYPAMIKAIDQAKVSITLATYIFGNDKAGGLFVDALANAIERGVEVRVLIDYVGARYSHPSVVHQLRNKNIRTALFLPSFNPLRTQYSNLRSHRKMMVADGRIAFTGGMNIRRDNLLKENPAFPVQDIHFRITGPVVRQIQEALVEDWRFATDEILEGEKWFPELEGTGNVLTRGIIDGPDEDYDKLRQVILGALNCARRSIRISTPYFLPDDALIAAMNTAAMRGVKVEIYLPVKNNLRIVGWAINAQLWQVLERGCHVYLTAPPFEHTKIMVIDGAWCCVGSANWDPRSLRLNFEFNIECYDTKLAGELEAVLDAKRRTARETTLAEMDSRSTPVRLRDGIARLFFPYL